MTTILAFQLSACEIIWMSFAGFSIVLVSLFVTLTHRNSIKRNFNSMMEKIRNIKIPIPQFELPVFAPSLIVSAVIIIAITWLSSISEIKPCEKENTVMAIVMPCGCK